MPIYYLHIYNRTGASRDEEGSDLPDLASARAAAIAGIRSMLCEEVGKGEVDFNGRIEIVDENQRLLEIVRYSEAVRIRPEDDPA